MAQEGTPGVADREYRDARFGGPAEFAGGAQGRDVLFGILAAVDTEGGLVFAPTHFGGSEPIKGGRGDLAADEFPRASGGFGGIGGRDRAHRSEAAGDGRGAMGVRNVRHHGAAGRGVAAVETEGSALTVVAEHDGSRRLALPEGAHVLTVSYAGLDRIEEPVAVVAGQTVTKNFELTTGICKVEAVAASGLRDGSARAIQAQRQSENPKWLAATDTFGNPAAKPGELIQRLPGVSTDVVGSDVRTLYVRGMGPGFSSLMVDGERVATSTGTSGSRDYQIEQLGTGNLESVELIKAPQPEQDANAVAGFVNLVSRRAFDAPGRRITVSGGVMWRLRQTDESPFKDRPDNLDLLSVADSDVFNVLGGRKNLGVAFNVNRRISAATRDEAGPGGVLHNFSQTYLNPNTTPLTRIFGSDDIGYEGRAHHAGLSLDYKLSPDAFVFFRGANSTNDQFQEYYRPGIGNPTATAANFAPGAVPPAVLMAWESILFTEIEMVVAAGARPAPTGDRVAYLPLPWLTPSPRDSKVCHIAAGTPLIFVAGVDAGETGSAREQMKTIIERIGSVLYETGSSYRNLVEATYYLAAPESRTVLGDIRGVCFDPTRAPADSALQVPGQGRPGRTAMIDLIAIPVK